MKYLINKHGFAVHTNDLAAWCDNFAKTRNKFHLDTPIGENRLSTVFLGLDHSFGGGPAILWESMLLSPEGDEIGCWRFQYKREAYEFHRERVRGAENNKTVRDY